MIEGLLYHPVSSTGALGSVSGIANSNSGTIQRVSVRSRLDHGVSVSNLSMGVINNSSTGVMRDIHIESQAEWKVMGFGTNVAAIAANNNGFIERALMKGRLLDVRNTLNTITDTSLGRTILNGSGSYSGVYTLSPAGRRIFSGTVTCPSTNALQFNASSTNSFVAGNVYWSTPSNNFVSDGKYVWVIGENNGDVRAMRVQSVSTTSPSVTLNLPAACAFFAQSSTKVNIVQSFTDNTIYGVDNNLNGEMNAGDVAFSGVADNSFPLLITNLSTSGSPWSGQYLDSSNGTHFDLLLSYYFSLLAGQNPVKPAPWEYEYNLNTGEIRLELLNIND